MVITYTRGLIAPLVTSHEPSSIEFLWTPHKVSWAVLSFPGIAPGPEPEEQCRTQRTWAV